MVCILQTFQAWTRFSAVRQVLSFCNVADYWFWNNKITLIVVFLFTDVSDMHVIIWWDKQSRKSKKRKDVHATC